MASTSRLVGWAVAVTLARRNGGRRWPIIGLISVGSTCAALKSLPRPPDMGETSLVADRGVRAAGRIAVGLEVLAGCEVDSRSGWLRYMDGRFDGSQAPCGLE
jgi:hypothetical protein